MKELNEKLYLQHILDAIAKVETYLQGIDESDFYANSLFQDAIIRQIEIIGEATKQLSPELRQKHSHIPWKAIAGTRDKLIHGYIAVNLNDVWVTAVTDLPSLKTEVEKILAE